MSQNAIEVQNLSKMFHIGELIDQDEKVSIGESLMNFISTPFRRAKSVLQNQLPERADATLWALRDINFEVKQGEVLGIIGRNGAGKSTLLKILTGISRPTSGRALIRGRVGSLLEVGTGFHPELTGRENVFMNGSILGMKNQEIKARFDEIVAFSGVEKFIDTPVKRYSSGMQVRLAFSVAAHLDPEVLLVDEVLSVGDAEFRRKCLGKMRDVTGQGRTVVLVSHNMTAIQHLSDRAILLEQGQIVMEGDPDSVVEYYLKSGYQAATSATADLTNPDHPNRKVGSDPIIRAISLRDTEGEATGSFLVGDTLTIEVDIDAHGEVFDASTVNIDVVDSYDNRICKLVSRVHNGESFTIEGKQTIRCVWDDCILAPGEYAVSVSIRSSKHVNVRGGLTIDRVDRVVSFEVFAGNSFGTGYSLSEGRAVIWPRVDWDVQHQNRINPAPNITETL